MRDWQQVDEGIEVSGFSIDGIGDVEGLKIFSKIKKFAKKVGKGLKKLTIKKVLGVAVPIASLALAPLAGASLASLAKKVGSSAAGKIKAGKTVVRAVKAAGAAKAKVAMISPAAQAKLLALGIPLGKEITPEQLAQVTGEPASSSIVAGDVQEGAAMLEIAESAKEVAAEKKGLIFGLSLPVLAAGGGLALWALKKKQRRQ